MTRKKNKNKNIIGMHILGAMVATKRFDDAYLFGITFPIKL